MVRKKMAVALGCAVALALIAGGALAVGGRRNGPHGQPGKPGGHGLGECILRCMAPAQACIKAARNGFRSCVGDCAPQVMAAGQACGDDDGQGDSGDGGDQAQPPAAPSAAGCTAAQQALAACLRPCRTTYVGARQQCAHSTRDCANDCRLPTPTPSGE
jgi:hypothetical protein